MFAQAFLMGALTATGMALAVKTGYHVDTDTGMSTMTGVYRVRDTDGDDRFDDFPLLRQLNLGYEHPVRWVTTPRTTHPIDIRMQR